MCKDTISVFEFMEMFPNEEKAIGWFESKRWGGNVTCPACTHKSTGNIKRKYYYQCHSCKLKFTVRTNTVMHRSHIPLPTNGYTRYIASSPPVKAVALAMLYWAR